MKKIIILFVGILLFGFTSSFAQGVTLTIGDVSATSGSMVSIPINVTNFTNVGAISLKINYDPSALIFVDTANSAMRSPIVNGANGVVSIGWYDNTGVTPINISNGKLVDLVFISSGKAGTVTFNSPLCDIASESGVSFTNVTYNDGGVAVAGPTLKLQSVIASTPGSIMVPIVVKNFTSIGAVSLKFSYNTNALTYSNLLNAPNGATATASGGVITIGWYDNTGVHPLTLTDNTALLGIVFTYNGGASNLTFNTSACDLADSAGNSLSGVTYIDGTVSAGTSSSISFPAMSSVNKGDTLYLPVTAKNFPDIGSVSLKVKYNPAVLNFAGVTNTLSGVSFTSSASTGTISLGWYDATGHSPIKADSSVLLNLKLVALQPVVNSGISFIDSLSEFSDSVGSIIAGIVYNGGTVSVVTGLMQTPEIVNSYSLSQNYPNPFNPSTTIDFSVPKESKVVLKIYNLLGQEVATLVNNTLSAGKYSYNFNADNLSSGVYIYRLQAGTNTFTKKMTLLK